MYIYLGGGGGGGGGGGEHVICDAWLGKNGIRTKTAMLRKRKYFRFGIGKGYLNQ